MLPWKRHIPKTLRSLIAVGTLSALVALALGKTHDIALGQDPVPTKEQTKDPKRDPVKGSAEQAPVKKSDEQVPVKEAGGKDPLKKTDEKLPVKESDKKDPVKKTEELNENSKEITHEGQLIAMIGNRLTMTGKDGKARAFQLKRDAKLTLEGKACRATDLKPPMKLRVTTLAVEQGEAIRVEGLGMNPVPEVARVPKEGTSLSRQELERMQAAENSKEITHEGQLIAMIGNRLTMTGKDGKERAFQLMRDARLTLEGRACRATDLKPQMKLRVTTLAVEQGEAIRVEGLGMEPPRKSN